MVPQGQCIQKKTLFLHFFHNCLLAIDSFTIIRYITDTFWQGPVAQLVEQRTFNAWVTGSNPVRLSYLNYK